jgi:hypothetical protein
MITADYRTALSSFVDTNGERHFLLVTASAAYQARVFWVYSRAAPAFAILGGGSFIAPPGQIHSKEQVFVALKHMVEMSEVAG